MIYWFFRTAFDCLSVCVSVLSVCVRIFFGMHFFQRDTPPPATTAATRTTTTTTTEKSNYCRSPNNPHSQLKSANFYFSLINTFSTWKYAVVAVVVVLVATVGMLLPLEQARYAAKIPTPKTMHTLTPTHTNTHTQRNTHKIKALAFENYSRATFLTGLGGCFCYHQSRHIINFVSITIFVMPPPTATARPPPRPPSRIEKGAKELLQFWQHKQRAESRRMRAVRRECERGRKKKRENDREGERKKERELRALSFALSFARSLSLCARITAHSLFSCSCIALSISLSLPYYLSLSLSPACGRRWAPSAYGFGAFYATYAAYVARVLVCSCFYYIIRILLFSKFYKFLSAVARQIKAEKKRGKGAGGEQSLYFLDLLMYYICAWFITCTYICRIQSCIVHGIMHRQQGVYINKILHLQ